MARFHIENDFLIFSGKAKLMAFESYIELVTVIRTVDVRRDPKDNFLLALSKDRRVS